MSSCNESTVCHAKRKQGSAGHQAAAAHEAVGVRGGDAALQAVLELAAKLAQRRAVLRHLRGQRAPQALRVRNERVHGRNALSSVAAPGAR
jgi:hypothetical protein